LVAAAAALIACGGGTPNPAAPADTGLPLATPAPAPAPAAPASAAPVETSAAAASAAPAASGAPSADAPSDKPKRVSSGRPAVLKQDSAEVTDTFGSSPPAKITIGDTSPSVLVIPEFALDRGYNITFKLDKKGKSTGVPVGKIFHVMGQVGGSPSYTTIVSAGPPFELQMPAGSKKDANLAIGAITQDEKTGRESVTWKVIAPKRIDDAAGIAYFELTELPDAYLHVTTKPASSGDDAAKKAPAGKKK
jgi:hypothetical protein